MAKQYSVGFYLDGEAIDQYEVRANNPRLAATKAMRFWMTRGGHWYWEERQLEVDEQLTIQIVRREE
jgi:hypothetical protein